MARSDWLTLIVAFVAGAVILLAAETLVRGSSAIWWLFLGLGALLLVWTYAQRQRRPEVVIVEP